MNFTFGEDDTTLRGGYLFENADTEQATTYHGSEVRIQEIQDIDTGDRQDAILSLIGGVMIHLVSLSQTNSLQVLGSQYVWGNISLYCASYFG